VIVESIMLERDGPEPHRVVVHVALIHPQDAEELTRALRAELALVFGIVRRPSSLGRGLL
jgi:hypothetical protein